MSAIPLTTEPRLAAKRSSGGPYRSLEHWRGLAALSVMCYHAGVYTAQKPLHPLAELFKTVTLVGGMGVHIFFVISGYCIAANVQSLRSKGRGPAHFLADRLCRIMPTYWAAFGLSVLLAFSVAGFTTNHAYLPRGGRVWLGELLLIQPYLGRACYLVVCWTLVVEAGFYLMVALLFAISRASKQLAVWLALAFTLAAVWAPLQPQWLAVGCWPEFVCGLLAFHAVQAKHRQVHGRRNRCLGMIVLIGLVGGAVARYGVPPKFLGFSAVFALALYFLYPLDDLVVRARALRWLSFCGQFSYSLYLMHVPIGSAVYDLGARFFPKTGPLYVGLMVSFCLASVSAGYLFYRVFEARFELWRRRLKARPACEFPPIEEN